jgi:ADP-heptose:LPS heptosyltransferase
MGDIIQSSVLIKKLKHYYPESEISYLLLENFKETANFIPEIDEVISVDFSNILKNIDNLDIEKAFELCSEIVENKLRGYYDKVINLSFSKLSAFISYFINSDEKSGLTFTENNEFVAYDNWSRFFLSIVEHRHLSPFNLVDIYAQIGINSVNSFFCKDVFIPKNVNRKVNCFGFVLGASTYDRQWPPENFAKLGDLIFKNNKNAKIYLLGTKQEEILAEKFFSHASPNPNYINLTGKTSLKELGELIDEKIDVLVTNDTGTMHIGWFTGKKIVELSLGPALYNTTGPYGEGHIVIQPKIDCAPCNYTTKCRDLKCHYIVTPEIVFEAIEVLENKKNSMEKFYNVAILKSYFDSYGFLSYEYIAGKNGKEPVLNEKLKSIWLKTLEKRLKKNSKYIIRTSSLFQMLCSNIKSLKKFIDITVEMLHVKSSYKVEKNVETILELESGLRDFVFTNFPEFIPFWKYFEYTRNLFPDNNLKNSLIALKELVEIFYLQVIEYAD